MINPNDHRRDPGATDVPLVRFACATNRDFETPGRGRPSD